MRTVYGIVLVALLGGCSVFEAPGDQRPALETLANPACRDVARQRAEDAAVNGYAEIQGRVARDAYDICMEQQPARMASVAP